MANPTMTLIASNTVGSGGVSSVTFSSIPATYTDLILKLSVRDSDTSGSGSTYDNIKLTFNSNTSNYSWLFVAGNGSSTNNAVGSAQSNIPTIYGTYSGATSTTNTFGNSEVYIPNYTSSNNKSLSSESTAEYNGTPGWDLMMAGLWTNTSAITSITLSAAVSFVQYSTFYLYGINNS